MLVGAEVYYGRLEHVLDPRTRTASPRSNESRSGATGQKEAKKSATADDDARGNRFPLSSPLPSPTDANKRPSRRLIAMYRQIRDELVIVSNLLMKLPQPCHSHDTHSCRRLRLGGWGSGGRIPVRSRPRIARRRRRAASDGAK